MDHSAIRWVIKSIDR